MLLHLIHLFLTFFQKIMSSEDYQYVSKIENSFSNYQILSIKNGANKEEITKGYKFMALKVHPDKNKAPGATEAFKKLKKAYDCLCKNIKEEFIDHDMKKKHFYKAARKFRESSENKKFDEKLHEEREKWYKEYMREMRETDRKKHKPERDQQAKELGMILLVFSVTIFGDKYIVFPKVNFLWFVFPESYDHPG